MSQAKSHNLCSIRSKWQLGCRLESLLDLSPGVVALSSTTKAKRIESRRSVCIGVAFDPGDADDRLFRICDDFDEGRLERDRRVQLVLSAHRPRRKIKAQNEDQCGIEPDVSSMTDQRLGLRKNSNAQHHSQSARGDTVS